jgi:hypothetical protein
MVKDLLDLGGPVTCAGQRCAVLIATASKRDMFVGRLRTALQQANALASRAAEEVGDMRPYGVIPAPAEGTRYFETISLDEASSRFWNAHRENAHT